MRKFYYISAFFAVFVIFVNHFSTRSLASQTQKATSEFDAGFQAAFGSQKGNSRYSSQYDTNDDGRISAVDYLPLHLKSLQKGAASSQSETSQKISLTKNYKGYIIEFKDAPLAQQAQILDYKAAVLSRHEEAKKDILTKLGKKKFVAPSVLTAEGTSQDAVVILGEYTASFNGVALDINEKQAEALKTSSYIKRIRRNGGVRAFLNESVPLIKAPDVWNMKDSQGRAVTGQGVKIAIIDTGIDYTHQDLGSCTQEQFVNKHCAKVIGGYDFVNADNDPIDDNGHGTHVAATSAGNGALKGVSPDASLIAYKVLDQWGSGWDDDILAAIEAAIQTRLNTDTTDDIDIMNLSLGGWGDPADPLSQAIDRAADAGIVSAIAAGNSGPDEQTIGSPGLANKAITVGATNKTPKMADFSSKGPVIQMLDIQNEIIKPNIVTPGVNICAARADYNSSASVSAKEGGGPTADCDSKHILLSGTSMAAPHVAGAAALLKQLYPSWTPEEIKGALMSVAENLGETPFVQGSGMINVAKSAQATSLITPGSLSFGFVDKSSKNVTMTKELVIKSIKKTVSYSLTLNQGTAGASISFSENNFSLNPSESKTIQVRLSIDNEILGEGLYVNEILIAEDGVESYRVPVAFFKKAILLALDQQLTNNAVFARITTPYVGLSSAPDLRLKSPSQQETIIPLVRSTFDPTKWDSGRIDLSENGTYSLNATSSQMPGYSASASVVADKIAPQFSIKAARSNQTLAVQITPNQNIRDPFYKAFSDENDGTGHNLNPSLLADNTNIYAVYQQFGTNKIYFVKSADGGGSWDKPVVLAQFPENTFFVLSSIAKLNGKLFVMLFDGQLKITSSSDGITWSTPTTVAGNVNILDFRTFAFKAGLGKLHLVYGGSRGGNKLSPVYYQNSSDGEDWSNPYKLGDTPMWTDLDMDINEQEIRIVYLKNKLTTDDRVIVYYATSKDGKTFSTRTLWESATTSYGILYPSITSSSEKTYIVLNNGLAILFIRASNQNNEVVVKGDITGVLPRIGSVLNKLYLAWTNLGGSPPFFLSLHIRRSENQGDSWGADLQSDTAAFFVGEMATAGNVLFLNWPSQEPGTGLLRIAFAASTNMVVEVLYNLKTEIIEATKSATDLWSASATWQGYGAYAVNVKGRDMAGNMGSSGATFNFPQPATIPLSARIQGIGNLEWWHNRNPLNKERVATVGVFDENKVQKKTVQATLTFDGNVFSGTADLSDLPQGAYYLTLKLNNSLSKLTSSVPITIAQGSKITVQGGGPPTLTMGDVNNNDSVDINDYYKLVSCFGNTTSSARWKNDCEFSDFYDDGRISIVDYSVLITYYGKKGDAVSGLPGALTKPQTTNVNKVVYVETKIGCLQAPKGLSPDQICQKQGYTRSVEVAGTAANGYWWKQCGGASVSNCQGINCSVNKLDCTNTPGYWGTQQPYPSRYKKAGKSNTVYRPTELGFSCRGYAPGWTMRVACQGN